MKYIEEKDIQYIFKLSEKSLFKFVLNYVSKLYESSNIVYNEKNYIIAKGTMPVALVAHLDVVYKTTPKEIIVTNNPLTWSSPTGICGDDRCGVVAILTMLLNGLRPTVIFTCGEEKGCTGASQLTRDGVKKYLDNVNALIQIDRRGNNDIVRYTDDNLGLTEAIESVTDYRRAYGSFTDICKLMPYLGVSGVNLSCGYYCEHHGASEKVVIKDFKHCIKTLYSLLTDHKHIFDVRYTYSYGFRFIYGHGKTTKDFYPVKKTECHRVESFIKDSFLCDTCGGELSRHFKYCPFCGSKITADDDLDF